MLATVRPDFAPLQAQFQEGISTDISASYSPLSSPTTPLDRRLYPRPLNIFRRPSRRSLVRLTTPVNSIPESIFEAEDPALIPRPLSIASTPAPSPTHLSNIATNPRTFDPVPASSPPSIPASPSPSTTSPPPPQPITPTPPLTPISHTPNATTCTLCFSPLIPLQTYTLPKTAPALTSKIHTLYPTIIPPTTPAPTFCTTCFSTIRALHLCWGCGDPIHRPEERVGCGWAWWHWGCVRCLLCRVGPPLPPPSPISKPLILSLANGEQWQNINNKPFVEKQAPLPPPPWTHAPTTLSVPPSCKPCTRELRELAYAERIRKQTLNPIVRGKIPRRATSNGGTSTNPTGITSPAASIPTDTEAEADPAMSRKVSLGVRYPPLPRWMEKLPGNRRGVVKGEGREVRWMEKLPGRRQQGKGATRVGEQIRRMDGWGRNGRKGEQRSGSGVGVGVGVGIGDGYGSVRGRIVVA